MDFIKPQMVDMKTHNELNEKWVQSIIAEDPNDFNYSPFHPAQSELHISVRSTGSTCPSINITLQVPPL